MSNPIRAALCLLAVLAAAPAAAGEKTPSKAELQAVEIAPVGLPIVWQGRQVNYVFTTVRLTTAPGADLSKARAKEPYFRDALIRLAHRHPFTDPHDLTRIDERALKAALWPEAQRIAGPGVIAAVVVVSQQPQRREGLPSTRPPPPPVRAPIP